MRKVLAVLIALASVACWAIAPTDSFDAFAQEGAPRLNRIRPARITSGAPTFTVLLEGKRFVQGARVRLDGVDLDPSRVAKDGKAILAEIDPSVVAAPGTHTIQAVNPDGMTSATETLTVVDPDPELDLQLDASNAAEEDQQFPLQFPISGEGFNKRSKVLIWGKASSETTFISDTELNAVIGSGFTEHPARIPVMVSNKGGRLSNVQIFFIVPRPASIDNVDPDTFEVGEEDLEIKVSGGNFRPDAELVINGLPVEITRRREGRLEADLPADLVAQPGLISVRVQQDGIQSQDFIITVTPTEDPFIYTSAPALIRQGDQRETIEIVGANFDNKDKVLLDGEEVEPRNSTRRRLTIVVKKELLATTGTHTLQVRDQDGNLSNIVSFSVVPDVTVATLAGRQVGFNFDDLCVSREAARFRRPRRMAMGPDGLIYLTDQQNHAIRTLNPATGEVCTIAGTTGSSGYNDSGNPRDFPITFSFPNGVAVASNGDVFVTENGNHVIRLIQGRGAAMTVSTFAGRFREETDRDRQNRFKSTRNGKGGYFDDEVNNSAFNLPDDIIIAPDGTMYLADANNHAIRRIRRDGSRFMVETVAGNGVPGFADGFTPNARFNTPTALALSLDGRFLFVADTNNNRVRRIELATGRVTTVAGSGLGGTTDGPAIEATFFQPIGLAIDLDGILYISEVTGNRIRRLDTSGNVTTLAGGDGLRFKDGAGLEARFNSPRGLIIDRQRGMLFVADTEHFAIRTIQLP
ncbi:MAG: SMP-30/gluconolactonase/LRE family protein [Acidobacteriota bacterium]